MPTIIVHGIPSNLKGTPALSDFVRKHLPAAAASIPEMKISAAMVDVFIAEHMASNTQGKSITVTIEDLFRRPERTAEALERFAEAIRDCIVNFARTRVHSCRKIQVVPRFQDAGNGYTYWEESSEALGVFRNLASLLPLLGERGISYARDQVVEALLRGSDIDEAWLAFRELATERIKALPDKDQAHGRAQVLLTFAVAGIWYDAGQLNRCLEELRSAKERAEGKGFEGIADLLDHALHLVEGAD
jgi:hypothetical protein